MRPFGSGDAASFEKLCDGCGDCVTACPQSIIFRGTDGRAVLDLTVAECTFCEICIDVCPTGALSQEGRESWTWVARAEESCLAMRGVTCRTCEDFCDQRAIRFRLEPGGRSSPLIDEAACTGCGSCAGGCPEGAISFARRKSTEPQKELNA